MNRMLLTGAAGMLGRRLLEEALVAGKPVAVLVRGTRLASAERRVEEALSGAEQRRGRPLPRPVVVPGDLNEHQLGLQATDARWIARNCTHVLHSAAKVVFRRESRTNEPYRTNVEGTRRLLEFCRAARMEGFHHVSTAYVCGRRRGHILESELDVGQSFGNDYEKSKFESEKLIRSAAGLKATIYRPSIIVGDASTGESAAFRGVYTPLQLGCYFLLSQWGADVAEADKRLLSQEVQSKFFNALGLTDDAVKNLVSVDWTARAILHVLANEGLHGRTHHITHPVGVSASLLRKTMFDAVMESIGGNIGAVAKERIRIEASDIQAHMETYRPYFRSDPVFESSLARSGGEPAPAWDETNLKRIWAYAVESRFGAIRKQAQALYPGSLLNERLSRVAEGDPSGEDLRFFLQASGPGGGEWTVSTTRCGQVVRIEKGRTTGDDTLPIVYAAAPALTGIIDGNNALETLLDRGAIHLRGPAADRDAVRHLLPNLLYNLVGLGEKIRQPRQSQDARQPQPHAVG